MSYYEEETRKKSFWLWTLIKWFFALLAIAVYLLLTLRACAFDGLKDTAKTRALLRNEAFTAAYAASPDDFSVLASPDESITTPDGRLIITNIHKIDSARQLQLTVRYNNSLARVIMDEFSLNSEPQGELLVFALRDDAGNLYTSFEYITDKAFVYNFRRLVFDGVKLDNIKTLNLEVYFIGYADYENQSAPLGSITVYNIENGFVPYSPKKGELEGGITAGLIKSSGSAGPDNAYAGSE